MATIIRVHANTQWGILQGSGGNWIGVCDALKLTVQSETWAELMEDIGLTLDAILKDLLASHELEGFLRDRGWNLINQFSIAPDAPPESIRFDVPFFPAMMAQHGPTSDLHQ